MNVAPLVETTLSWKKDGIPMGPLTFSSLNLMNILDQKDNEKIIDVIYDAVQKKGFDPVQLDLKMTCTMIVKREEGEE